MRTIVQTWQCVAVGLAIALCGCASSGDGYNPLEPRNASSKPLPAWTGQRPRSSNAVTSGREQDELFKGYESTGTGSFTSDRNPMCVRGGADDR